MTYIQELRLMKRTAWMNIQREVHPPVQPNSAKEFTREQLDMLADIVLAEMGRLQEFNE